MNFDASVALLQTQAMVNGLLALLPNINPQCGPVHRQGGGQHGVRQTPLAL
jgi:hypothetical protein